MPRTSPTPLLATRTWQQRLHHGRFRRNSVLARPFIWFFQQEAFRQHKPVDIFQR